MGSWWYRWWSAAVANVQENSKKIIEHWRNVLKCELWIFHTNKNNKPLFYNNRDFSGRIFLEKAFLYKYVGNKIVKKDDRKEIYEENKKLLTLWSVATAASLPPHHKKCYQLNHKYSKILVAFKFIPGQT